MRLAAQAKGGFYPTPPRVLDLLATLLRPPARLPARSHGTVRLLDPCCGAGAALAQLPLRRGHLAMLVAAGFLDNLCLEANGQRLLVKGRTAKELVLVTRTREQEVRRERLRTTVVALDLATGTITDIAA